MLVVLFHSYEGEQRPQINGSYTHVLQFAPPVLHAAGEYTTSLHTCYRNMSLHYGSAL